MYYPGAPPQSIEMDESVCSRGLNYWSLRIREVAASFNASFASVAGPRTVHASFDCIRLPGHPYSLFYNHEGGEPTSTVGSGHHRDFGYTGVWMVSTVQQQSISTAFAGGWGLSPFPPSNRLPDQTGSRQMTGDTRVRSKARGARARSRSV